MDKSAQIRGQVERIQYQNEENGYTVAKIHVKGQKDLVTVVGSMPGIAPGEELDLWGDWTTHPTYGDQFKVKNHKSTVPAGVLGIEKYLGSGLIKGIGPVMAKRLVARFGEETLDIIDKQPKRLGEVEGVGKKRIRMIKDAWDAQREIREVMVFLQGHGVSPAYATKIYRHYGKDAVDVVRENPYRLAEDIYGIGFVKADQIAMNLGIDKESDARAKAGVMHCLHRFADEGHVFYPYEPLVETCWKLLDVPDTDGIVKAVAALIEERRLVVEDLNKSTEAFFPNHKAVYLTGYHLAEKGVAQSLKILLQNPSHLRAVDPEKALEWVQQRIGFTLSSKQQLAVKTAVTEKVMVLTGGPGTGKTTILKAVLQIFRGMHVLISLGAPTGRAAKKLHEATGSEAMTLHRLLEWDFRKMGFKRDAGFPLPAEVVIVDEASMIDTLLMHHFLKAVSPGAVLILVGDVNQLPSVGAGNVLNDIIASGAVPVVELDEIFRQAEGSLIIRNAHLIHRGIFPELGIEDPDGSQDFYFIERETPEDIARTILDLVIKRIPAGFKMDPMNDIQVLTPMNRGPIGTNSLNEVLREALNPSGREINRGGRLFKQGDRVMQIRNNYDKEVYNGDIGIVESIDYEDQNVIVDFEGTPVLYDFTQLDELTLAYAVSVHKSQGSEYPAVVMPVHTSHFILLQRNLIYTGLTRARKLAVFVGTKKALNLGIRNDKTQKRYTGLIDKLAP